MKMRIAITALAMASVPTLAASATPRAASPLLGRWTLDTNSMTIPVEARPASVTVEFTDAGDGHWTTSYVITAKDGSARRMTSREPLDGTPVPIAGDHTEADTVAMTSPQPGVLVMGLGKWSKLGSVRVYTVSADGREMTENAPIVSDDGKPLIRRFRWVR